MEESEYRLEHGDREVALERLAERLGIEEIPEAVADNLSPDLLWAAYRMDEEEHWGEVEKEAQKLLNVHHGSSGVSRPPGRGDREVPHKIVVEPDEDTLRRAQAFSEVAGYMGNRHPRVKQFRRMHLHGRLLADEEARDFLDRRCDGPLPTRHGTNAVSRKLWKLAEKLGKTYSWREGDAVWFVLTGSVPLVRPVEVTASISQATKQEGRIRTRIPNSSPPRYMAPVPKPTDYHPNTARITITADAWVSADEVKRAFREAQSQILDGGDAAGQMTERKLKLVQFVSERIRTHGEETWEERRKVWKELCPKEWRYSTYNGFRQAFVRFLEGHVHRPYELPNYRRPEPTPYQAYRDDWMKRRKGTG